MEKPKSVFYILLLIIMLSTYMNCGRLKSIFTGKKTQSDVESELQKKWESLLIEKLQKSGISFPPKNLILIGLKEEKILEVWTLKENEYTKLWEYNVLAASGHSGPKLKEGDRQVPEGFYKLEYLNPNSSFHLSLLEKLNFNLTDLGEIFNKNNPCQTGFSYILEELINRNKEDIIYYLFEHIKPENIINSDKKITYIKNLIYANNYSLFMFIMEKMQSIKLLTDFTYYDSSNIMDSISDTEKTDYKIIYELLKLDIEPKRGTKLYELYRMIKFSNKHYYY